MEDITLRLYTMILELNVILILFLGMISIFVMFITQLYLDDDWPDEVSPLVVSGCLQGGFILGYYIILDLDKDVWDPEIYPSFGKFKVFRKENVGLDISVSCAFR